ncbi:MAG: hypothetical protein GY795_03680 [Desulfobacterales bacterium]|nr:hypothetical protein [Desulfobacterales bacterium]
MASMFVADFFMIPIINPEDRLFSEKKHTGFRYLFIRLALPAVLWIQQRISLWYFFLQVDVSIGTEPDKRDDEHLHKTARQCIELYELFDNIVKKMTPEKYGKLPFFLKCIARDIERYHDDLACCIETLADILHPDNPLTAPILLEIKQRMAFYEDRRPEYSISE